MLKTDRSKKKLMGLASALEMGMSYEGVADDFIINAARQIKTTLRGNIPLTEAEKVRIVKLISRAKARAFLGGPADDYQTYRVLDMISSDLVRML